MAADLAESRLGWATTAENKIPKRTRWSLLSLANHVAFISLAGLRGPAFPGRPSPSTITALSACTPFFPLALRPPPVSCLGISLLHTREREGVCLCVTFPAYASVAAPPRPAGPPPFLPRRRHLQLPPMALPPALRSSAVSPPCSPALRGLSRPP